MHRRRVALEVAPTRRARAAASVREWVRVLQAHPVGGAGLCVSLSAMATGMALLTNSTPMTGPHLLEGILRLVIGGALVLCLWGYMYPIV